MKTLSAAISSAVLIFGLISVQSAHAMPKCSDGRLSNKPVGTVCVKEVASMDRTFRRVSDAYTNQLGILHVDNRELWFDSVHNPRTYSKAIDTCPAEKGMSLPAIQDIAHARDGEIHDLLPANANGMFWANKWHPVDNEAWDELVAYDGSSFQYYRFSRYETYRPHQVLCVATFPALAPIQARKSEGVFSCQFRPHYSPDDKGNGIVEFDTKTQLARYRYNWSSSWNEIGDYLGRTCQGKTWTNLDTAKKGTEAVIHAVECLDSKPRKVEMNRFGDGIGEIRLYDKRFHASLWDCKRIR